MRLVLRVAMEPTFVVGEDGGAAGGDEEREGAGHDDEVGLGGLRLPRLEHLESKQTNKKSEQVNKQLSCTLRSLLMTMEAKLLRRSPIELNMTRPRGMPMVAYAIVKNLPKSVLGVEWP